MQIKCNNFKNNFERVIMASIFRKDHLAEVTHQTQLFVKFVFLKNPTNSENVVSGSVNHMGKMGLGKPKTHET